jgi:hypothetical protein
LRGHSLRRRLPLRWAMQRRWTFHSFHEEVTVVVRASASPLELASAEDGSAAVAHLERLLRWERHRGTDQRQLLIGMAELSVADARPYSTDALQRAVFNRLRGSGPLILVRDLLEEAECDLANEPAARATKLRVHHAPAPQPMAPKLASPSLAPSPSGGAAAMDAVVRGTELSKSAVAAPPSPSPSITPGKAKAGLPTEMKAAGSHAHAHAHAREDGTGWSGDSSKWSQEKKQLSMHPDLRPKVTAVLAGLARRGFQPKIFFAWRSVAVQLDIFKKGHTKVKFSFHNAQQKDGTPNAYSADIVDARWGWAAKAEAEGFWKALGAEANAAGLHWGGDWKTFRDVAHVQLVPNSELKRVKKESGL